MGGRKSGPPSPPLSHTPRGRDGGPYNFFSYSLVVEVGIFPTLCLLFLKKSGNSSFGKEMFIKKLPCGPICLVHCNVRYCVGTGAAAIKSGFRIYNAASLVVWESAEYMYRGEERAFLN